MAAVAWTGERARVEYNAAVADAVRAGVDRAAVAHAAGLTLAELHDVLADGSPSPAMDQRAPSVALSIVVIGLALCITGLIAWVDHATGPLLPLSALYVIPVALAAWFERRGIAYCVALGAAAAGFVADRTLGPSAALADASWNLLAHAGLFLLLAETVWRTRRALLNERALAGRERAARAQLREADELKTTLLRAVSHDIREPLTAVLGSSSTLVHARGELPEQDARALAEGIAAAARRMARIVDGLLDVERISEGAVAPDRRPTRVDVLASQVVGEWREAARPVVLDAEPAVAVVDAVHVERILDNLIRNAVRHGSGKVVVKVVTREDLVRLAVEDEGPGVPVEERPDIFSLFTTGSTASAGLGVGLYLVSQFAKLNGGRATVGEASIGGASFQVEFPTARSPV
jgi:signal transduction histidine kinase